MNAWGRELGNIRDLMVIRYEDLRAQPQEMLRRVLEFIGTPAGEDELWDAVGFASVENMRQLEQKRVFWLAGRRMLAKDRSNPNTYKVRRAKVGGYRTTSRRSSWRRSTPWWQTGCYPSSRMAVTRREESSRQVDRYRGRPGFRPAGCGEDLKTECRDAERPP
jgi:hypothetical protein